MTTVEPPAGAAGGPGPDRDGRAELPTVPPLGDALRPGACTGVGSLPHRSVHDAAAFALREYDLPAIPTLPRRSPAEGMIAQALVGIGGVTLGQYGSIAVDADHLDPAAPVATDIGHDAYGGLRAFLADALGPAAPRAGQVAVHRTRHARRRADPRRRARRPRVRRRRRRGARPRRRHRHRRGRARCRRRPRSSGSTSRGSAS